MDNLYSPPQAELEQVEARASGRRLRPGWGPVDVIQVSWELMQRDLGVWLAVAGIAFVINLVFNLAAQFGSVLSSVLVSAAGLDQDLAGGLAMGVLLIASVLSWLAQIYLYIGQVRLSLTSIRGGAPRLGALFGGYDVLLPALGASLVVGIGTFFGMILLFVPGIIFVCGVSLYLFVMVDQGRGPVEAVQQSWEITKGHKGDIFMTFLVAGLAMMVIGVCTCFLGFILLAPIYALGLGLIYETLAFGEQEPG